MPFMRSILVLIALLVAVYAQSDISVTKYYIGMNAIAFADTQNIFILAGNYSLFRSADEGTTWYLQSTEQYMRYSSNYSVIGMYQDNVDSDKYIFISSDSKGGYWVTQDGGSNFQWQQPSNARMAHLRFHNYNSGWIVANRGSLAIVSKDMGSTWSNVGSAVTGQVAWGANNTIFYATSGRTLRYTDNFGQTSTQLFANVVGMIGAENHIIVGVNSPSGGFEVYIYNFANPGQGAPVFSKAVFPFGTDTQVFQLILLDTDAVWVALYHGGSTNDMYLYSADSNGNVFTTSIRHVYTVGALVDHEELDDVQGVSLVNTILNYRQEGSKGFSPQLQTQISFDNGGAWKPLAMPQNGYSCDNCTLNLNGLTSYVLRGHPPFYSSPTAIGLVLATGNVGPYLNTESEEQNVYLSRDDGLTWSQIMEGLYIYEFGDHGGILVLADTTTATQNITYSLDEGLTWTTFQFSNTSIDVDNIIIERSAIGRKFVLYGTEHTTRRGVVFGLDFTGLQEAVCQDSDYEPYSPSDGVSPQPCILGKQITYQRRKQTSKCYNDRDTEHVVSVVGCQCSFEDYECDGGFWPSTRNATGGFTCTPGENTTFPPDDPPADCPVGQTYEVTLGYRLVPDTNCDPSSGLNLVPQVKNCPGGGASSASSSSSTGTSSASSTSSSSSTSTGSNTKPTDGGGSSVGKVVAGLLISLIVVGGVVFGFFLWKNEEFRERIFSVFRRRTGPDYSRVATDII